MGVTADTDSVIPGIFKRGNLYGFRAEKPGGKGAQIRRGGFTTQDAAYQARIRFLAGSGVKSGLTVAAWFAEFLEVKEQERRPTTASGYRYCLSLVMGELGCLLLDELDEGHLRKAYKSLTTTHSTGTIKTVHWRVRTALRQAVREGRTPRCPANNVVPPKGKQGRKRKTWSFAELIRFTEYTATQRDATLWALWVTTGLRRGEVCGLKWPKVDCDDGLATIDWQRTLTADGRIVEGPPKTEDGERIVPVCPRVVEALRTWKASQAEIRLAQGERWRGGDYVFTSRLNQPYYPDSFNDRLSDLCERAGVPRLTPHELRHTYATRAVEAGEDVTVLSKLLGHSRVEVTLNLYVHPSNEQSRALNDSLSARMFGS